MKSWKPELLVDGEWAGNALRFATKEEAEASASDTYSRWMLAVGHRAVESDDPVNYKWLDGKGLVNIETV